MKQTGLAVALNANSRRKHKVDILNFVCLPWFTATEVQYCSISVIKAAKVSVQEQQLQEAAL
jgi:hypothetical protein